MTQIAQTADGQITIRKAAGTWVVRADGAVIAESTKALEVTEAGQSPIMYFPRRDVAMAFLDASDHRASNPHLGEASFFSVVSQTKTMPDAAWSYENPKAGLEKIGGYLAFHATHEVAVEQL
jgi:uncharacterized protein (DUF427 family)